MSIHLLGFTVGAVLLAAGVLLFGWSRRRLRAEHVAEHGPAHVHSGLYRSRQAKAGGHRG